MSVACVFSASPTLSHWMLRLFIEALQDCLPEAALFEGPPPLLSPSELISCGTLHPSSLAEADLVDPVCRCFEKLFLCSLSVYSTPSFVVFFVL